MKSREELVEIVVRHFDVEQATLFGSSRTPKNVLARHTLFYLMRTAGGLSASEVSRELDVDHTTVLHGSGVIAAVVECAEVANAPGA